MASGMLDLIKIASLDAVNTSKLTELRYGDVISVSPLKVKITNQLTLPSSVLVVPKHLTDYDVKVDVSWTTETTQTHTHAISGEKTIKIKNALKVGDKVALLREQGGRSYLILDKV